MCKSSRTGSPSHTSRLSNCNHETAMFNLEHTRSWYEDMLGGFYFCYLRSHVMQLTDKWLDDMIQCSRRRIKSTSLWTWNLVVVQNPAFPLTNWQKYHFNSLRIVRFQFLSYCSHQCSGYISMVPTNLSLQPFMLYHPPSPCQTLHRFSPPNWVLETSQKVSSGSTEAPIRCIQYKSATTPPP